METEPNCAGSKQDNKIDVVETKTKDSDKTADGTDVDPGIEHNREMKEAEDTITDETMPAEGQTSAGASGTEANTAGVAGSSKGTANKQEANQLPFQLQIIYTDTEGAKALRVITDTKPITRDRKKAEKSMYSSIVYIII